MLYLNYKIIKLKIIFFKSDNFLMDKFLSIILFSIFFIYLKLNII